MPPYYYSQMSREEQSVYHAMKEGVTALRPSFPVPRMEMRELSSVLFRLRLDCPEIFWVTGFSCRVHPLASSMECLPEYLFDKDKVKAHRQAMEARRTKLVRSALALSDWEKEQYVHDFICRNVRYDKLKKPYSHEIIGPLGQGVGVCEGIAKSVKLLCDTLGLESVIAISENAPDKGIRYRHAWNLVRRGKGWHHLDATFDDTLTAGGEPRYDYFGLDDRQVFRDHQPVVWPVPSCIDGDHTWYREKKLSFTRPEDVAKRATQAIRKKKDLTFHWRGGYLTREVLGELMARMESAATEKGRHVQVSLNWPQAVLRASFPEQAPAEAVMAQEANEGEQS
ncbi:transglutaminase domain-containing protein [Pseudoflavonifractor sp. MSJ-37]|uniref:transglutaminase domain-containing protein n=1 Tax=Pseudoflavonifractor sp. MSJ-37 TaxID=2841531 RepID=UPI001C11346E|nr:transglutaminase domain-containing protein [Pseudoflavonifractor sp. MSJ-37]MBU5434200.1 peptidase [Pseudoflavonifractor sp. MSJ-37]